MVGFSELLFLIMLFCFMFYSLVVGREVTDCRKELAALNDNMVALIELLQRSINERSGSDMDLRATAQAYERVRNIRRASMERSAPERDRKGPIKVSLN